MYNPAHPGEILKELLIEPLELSITDVSAHLNISRKTLSKVLNGKSAINPELALRLELVFKKPSAEHWLRLQNAYDLWQLVRCANCRMRLGPKRIHRATCPELVEGNNALRKKMLSASYTG